MNEEGAGITGTDETDESFSADVEEESREPSHQDEPPKEVREIQPLLVEQGNRPTLPDLGSLRQALQEAVKTSPKDSTQFSHRLWTWEFITAVCLSCRRN